jgi:hypothetical protein
MRQAEKVIRRNTVDVGTDVADSFGDRRLSDLLPTEIVRQIGFDPESLVFDRNTFVGPRRMTDPGLLAFHLEPPFQRRSNTIDPMGSFTPSDGPPQISNWFLVELSDTRAPAFSTFPLAFSALANGVVVGDGEYLRFGRLVEELRAAPEFTRASLQVLGCDKEYQLSEYLGVQAELAGNLARTFLTRAKCPAQFVSVEPVSYRGRSLFRLKVSDADAENIGEVVRLIIQAFGVAVEVFD